MQAVRSLTCGHLRNADNYQKDPRKEWSDDEIRLINNSAQILAELKQAERVIRHAAQEAAGRVKSEIVGGWLHHADKIRAAIAKATA